LAVKCKTVHVIIDGFVRSPEPEQIRRHNTCTDSQKFRDHVAVEKAPCRLAMQTKENMLGIAGALVNKGHS
jgi:hypothetical protein